MASKDDTAAYEKIEALEKTALTDYEAALTTFKAAVDEIAARFPNSGVMTPVRQYIANSRSMNTDYQLANLKQQYGLVDTSPMITPAVTTGGTDG